MDKIKSVKTLRQRFLRNIEQHQNQQITRVDKSPSFSNMVGIFMGENSRAKTSKSRQKDVRVRSSSKKKIQLFSEQKVQHQRNFSEQNTEIIASFNSEVHSPSNLDQRYFYQSFQNPQLKEKPELNNDVSHEKFFSPVRSPTGDQAINSNQESLVQKRRIRPQTHKGNGDKKNSRSNSKSRVQLYEKQLLDQMRDTVNSSITNYKSLLQNHQKGKSSSNIMKKKLKQYKDNYVKQQQIYEDPVSKEIQNMILKKTSLIKKQSKKLNKDLVTIKYQAFKSSQLKMPETNFDRQRKLQLYDEEILRMQKKINKFKLRSAQGQSDKIELMRDIATYDSNACEELNLRKTLLEMHSKAKGALAQIVEIDKATGKFNLLLDEIRDGLFDIESQKKNNKGGRQLSFHWSAENEEKRQALSFQRQMLTTGRTSKKFSRTSQNSLVKKNSIVEYFNETVCGINCSIRVKIKDQTFNVQCSPILKFHQYRGSMKLKLKRRDFEQNSPQNAIKSLFFLVDKQQVPTIYYQPKEALEGLIFIYKMRGYKSKSLLNVRVVKKENKIAVQILGFIDSLSEKSLQVRNIEVIYEELLELEEEFKIKYLFIRKREEGYMIHYNAFDEDDNNVNDSQFLEIQRKIKGNNEFLFEDLKMEDELRHIAKDQSIPSILNQDLEQDTKLDRFIIERHVCTSIHDDTDQQSLRDEFEELNIGITKSL